MRNIVVPLLVLIFCQSIYGTGFHLGARKLKKSPNPLPRTINRTYLPNGSKGSVFFSVKGNLWAVKCSVSYGGIRLSLPSSPCQAIIEISNQIKLTERNVSQLEALLTSFILDSAKLPSYEENIIRDALYRARASEGELRTAEQFWNQIVEENKRAEKDSHDLAKGSF